MYNADAKYVCTYDIYEVWIRWCVKNEFSSGTLEPYYTKVVLLYFDTMPKC